MNGENSVKIGKAAKILGVSIDTVRRWTNSGKLPSVRTPGGTRLYQLSELEKIAPKSVPALEEMPKFAAPAPATAWVPSFVAKKPTIYKKQTGVGLKKFFLGLGAAAIVLASTVGTFFIAGSHKVQVPSQEQSNVLAAETASNSGYLQINSDIVFNGAIKLPSNSNSFTLNSSAETNFLTVVGGITLDQNLSKTSSPTFANLSLAAGTLVFTDNTQTLTNKTLSGSSNTFSNIPNSALSNSKITINTSGTLTGGGDVSLGSSISLAVSNSTTFTTATFSGTLGVGGEASLSAKLILDSATAQINAVRNQNLKLGFQNTGRVEFLSSSNYIDQNGNLYIAGTLVSGAGASQFWQEALGALAPTNITDDLLIGGTATSSSTTAFQVIGTGVNAGFLSNPTSVTGLNNIPGALSVNDILSVAATSSAYPAVRINATTGQAGLIINQVDTGGDLFAASAAGVNKFVINKSGNVGIGSAAPGVALDVNGTVVVTGFKLTTSPATNYVLVSDGVGNGSWTSTTGGGAFGAWTLTGSVIYPNAATYKVELGSVDSTQALGRLTSYGGVAGKANVIFDETGDQAILAASKSGSPVFTVDNSGFLSNPGTTTGLNKIPGSLGINDILTIAATSAAYPAASISAITGQAAVVIDQQGTGDLFTASVSGLNKFVITNAGNVGIGTSNPVALLDVNTKFNVLSGGNVGIGTTSPIGLLHVQGVVTGVALTTFNQNGGDQGPLTASISGTPVFLIDSKGLLSNPGTVYGLNKIPGSFGINDTLTIAATSAAYPAASISAITGQAAVVIDQQGTGDLFTASVSGLNKFVIQNNGNVGIGTTNAKMYLQVGTNGGVGGVQFVGNEYLGSWNGGGIAYLSAAESGNNITNDLQFRTSSAGEANVNVMRLTSGGNVGIGTTAAADFRLEIVGGSHIGPSTDNTSDLGSSALRFRNLYAYNINTPLNQTGQSGYWQRALGVLAPNSITDSLIIGKTATPSGAITTGSIQFYGVNNLTPVASISAVSATAAFIVDNATGDLFTASSSGLNRFVITQNGNVGIGTTVPADVLEVAGNVRAARLTDRDSTSYYIDPGNTGTSQLVAGNVGIGTTNALALLYVNSPTYPVTLGGNGPNLASNAYYSSGWKYAVTGPAEIWGLANVGGDFAIFQTASGTAGNAITWSQIFTVTNPGNVGIGTSAPVGLLHVEGVVTGKTLATFNQNGGDQGPLTASISGTPVFLIDNLGLISNPGTKYGLNKIPGSVGINDLFTIAATSAAYPAASISAITGQAAVVIDQQGTGDLFTASVSGLNKFVITNAGNVGIGTANPSNGMLQVGTGATPTLVVTAGANGNVGIGTTAPGARLQLKSSGTSTVLGIIRGGDTFQLANISEDGSGNGSLSVFNGSVEQIKLAGGTSWIEPNSNSNVGIGTTTPVGLLDVSTKLVVLSGGNVGIGTTTPIGLLHVQGVVTGVALTTFNQNGGDQGPLTASISGVSVFLIDKLGQLSNPGTKYGGGGGTNSLAIPGALAINDMLVVTSTSTAYPAFYLEGNGGQSPLIINQQNSGGDLFAASAAGTNKFVINKSGNVGIGTTAPGYGFDFQNSGASIYVANFANTNTNAASSVMNLRIAHVAGNTADVFINFIKNGSSIGGVRDNGSGTAVEYSTSAVDLAEYMEAVDKSALKPGNLVGIATGRKVVAVTGTNVIGVYSTSPGFTGGVEKENSIRVGLVGQLPTIVSSVNGEIKGGDPITGSGLPGVGVKAVAAGAIIGTALESNQTWNAQTCPVVSSVDVIVWPEDNGTNQNKPCFRLSDGTYIGKIMVMVNSSWYQPKGTIDLTDLSLDISASLSAIPQIRTELDLVKEEMASVSAQLKQLSVLGSRFSVSGSSVLGSSVSGQLITDQLLSDNGQLRTDNLNVATFSAQFGTFSESLKVIGKTQLAETSIGGSLTVGLLHFDDLTAEISSLNGQVTIGSNLNVLGDATVSGQLKAKVVETEGVSLRDSATGEYYCIRMRNGEIEKTNGKCQ